jgi:hypothetical protein
MLRCAQQDSAWGERDLCRLLNCGRVLEEFGNKYLVNRPPVKMRFYGKAAAPTICAGANGVAAGSIAL